MGSEPGVGWNVVKQLVEHNQVWVLTRSDNRPFIEAELAQDPIVGLHFIYYDLPWWLGFLKSGQQLHYYLWQISVYSIVKPLHQQIQFDVSHHVTYVKYWSPSFLSLLPIPFIWGPVGGGESSPKPFWKDFSLRGKVYETLRDWARSLGEKDPLVHMTARRSHIAYATTEDTAQRLRKIGAPNVQVFSESGLPEIEITQLMQLANFNSDTIRFISMARLLHWKGLHLGLKAFAQAQLPNAEYWIFGEGAERKRLEALAETLGIAQQVKFWSRLPREQTLQKLGECVALVHPSLHDSGGWVCLEAMAAGCPVICLNLGGPSVQVTEKTGFKVAAETPEQAITTIARAMVQLAQDPMLRRQMGESGQRHVKEFYSWQAKARLLSQVYRSSIASRAVNDESQLLEL
jgi:glycosyltransferase involved in cell wall biosynthesis